MARILRGAPVAAAINEKTAASLAALKQRGVEPTLALVRVGEAGADAAYERSAVRRCQALGAQARCVTLPADVEQAALEQTLAALSADGTVHGILLFQPLPKPLDAAAACAHIAPEKDVDGVTAASAAAVYTGRGPGFAPCTAEAALRLLDFYEVPLDGRHAVVVGRSEVIGRPAAMLLLQRSATVTICHSHTRGLAEHTRQADVLVAAVGRAALLGQAQLRAGQTVVDVGVNVLADGTMVGDVDFAAAEATVDAVTPVPGGVGAVTTAVLLSHLAEAAQRAL